MPTYEYHCNSCQKNYELRQGFDAEPTHTCEECGKGIAKRVLVAPRVVFKGSGFYATDSRGRSSATADNSDSTHDSSSSDSAASAAASEPVVPKKAAASEKSGASASSSPSSEAAS